jgi:hypothetical protein
LRVKWWADVVIKKEEIKAKEKDTLRNIPPTHFHLTPF